jgi:beta-phosphoglucomutase
MMEVEKRLKACLFDLDGVVVDTFGYHFQAWQRTARQLGFELTREMHNELAGLSRMACLEKILDWGNIYISEAEKLYWSDIKNRWYVELISGMRPDETLPGVREFLQTVRQNDIRTALISSSTNAGAVLQSTRMDAYFDIVIDGNLIKKPKPHPERYLLAANALHLAPADCLVFEDSIPGIHAAKAGGFSVVGIGLDPVSAAADLVLPGFKHINLFELCAWFAHPPLRQASVS